MAGPCAVIERAFRPVVDVPIMSVDETPHASPLALDQDHAVARHATDDAGVYHRSGGIPVDGDVARPRPRDRRVAVVFQDPVDLGAADPVIPAAEDEAVTIAILPAERQG